MLFILLVFFIHLFGTNLMSASLQLYSNSFKNNTIIDIKYTCEGKDVSPHLAWKNVPKHTKSFVLLCEDPDAPRKTWVHWIVANIPGNVRELKEGQLINFENAQELKNDFKKTSYGGPCPPKGHGVHHYHFILYVLDTILDITPETTKDELLKAMHGHIIDKATLIGTFERESK